MAAQRGTTAARRGMAVARCAGRRLTVKQPLPGAEPSLPGIERRLPGVEWPLLDVRKGGLP